MITIISGTNRRNSYSLKMAHTISEILDKREIPNRVFSLEELPSDFIFKKINGEEDAETDQIIESNIISAQKFIFVIAEYNGGFPGVLKGFMDTVPTKYFKGKKASLVGIASGRGAALRPLDHFTGVLHYLQVEVLSDKPKFSSIEKCFDEHHKMIDEAGRKRVEDMCEKLLNF